MVVIKLFRTGATTITVILSTCILMTVSYYGLTEGLQCYSHKCKDTPWQECEKNAGKPETLRECSPSFCPALGNSCSVVRLHKFYHQHCTLEKHENLNVCIRNECVCNKDGCNKDWNTCVTSENMRIEPSCGALD